MHGLHYGENANDNLENKEEWQGATKIKQPWNEGKK